MFGALSIEPQGPLGNPRGRLRVRVPPECVVWETGFFSLLGAVAEATSDTLRVCAIQRSLARGHDKSCDPRHGAKISLILKGDNVPRIRD